LPGRRADWGRPGPHHRGIFWFVILPSGWKAHGFFFPGLRISMFNWWVVGPSAHEKGNGIAGTKSAGKMINKIYAMGRTSGHGNDSAQVKRGTPMEIGDALRPSLRIRLGIRRSAQSCFDGAMALAYAIMALSISKTLGALSYVIRGNGGKDIHSPKIFPKTAPQAAVGSACFREAGRGSFRATSSPWDPGVESPWGHVRRRSWGRIMDEARQLHQMPWPATNPRTRAAGRAATPAWPAVL